MREAETVSEMKALNLKVMQMETEVILTKFKKKEKKIIVRIILSETSSL